MSNAKEYPNSIKAVAMRLTRLNDCGVAPASSVASSRLTTASFVMCELTPAYDDGSEIKVKNGSGDIEVFKKGEPRLLGLSGTMKMTGVPIHVLEMTIGASLLLGAASAVIGGTLPGQTTDPGLTQLELWSRVGGEANCAAGGLPYYKWIAPLALNWKLAGKFVYSEENPLEVELEFFAQSNVGYTESIDAEAPATVTDAMVGGGPLSWFKVAALPTIADNSTYDAAA